MSKKHIVIFGGNSDIAKSVVKNLGENWNITLLCRSEKKSDLATVLQYDASNHTSIEKAVNSIETPIDVVLFTQGVMKDHLFGDQYDLDMEGQLTVNYNSIVHASLIILPKFLNQGRGHFIVMGSMAGLRGRASNYIYGSSKAAIMSFFDGLGSKYQTHNISVSIFVGGYIRTKMTQHMNLPSALTQSPQDVAQIIINKGVYKKKRWIYPNTIWFIISRILKLSPRWAVDLLP